MSTAADPVIVPRRQIKQNPEMECIVLSAGAVIVESAANRVAVERPFGGGEWGAKNDVLRLGSEVLA